MSLAWLLPLGAVYVLHRLGVVELDFPIRQKIRWRRGAPALPHASKRGLFSDEGQRTAHRIVEKYGLEAWEQQSGCGAFEASLFYLEMMERAFEACDVHLPDPLVAVDVGPSDWFYVQTLYAFLTFWQQPQPRRVSLDGVELDAWRLYRDLRSRADWAEAYVGSLPDVNYLAQDIRSYRRPVDLALMFFPFLFQSDHRAWGLPARYLQPAALLKHVVSLIQPGGILLVVNQGSDERDRQHQLFAEAGLPIAWSACHTSSLAEFSPERYVTLVQIPASGHHSSRA